MTLSIRKACEEDATEIATIGLDLSHRSEADNVRDYLAKLDGNDIGCVYVACEDEQVVGYVHAAMRNRLISGSTAEILELAVNKDDRLKGIGKMLIETVKEWAIDKTNVVMVRTSVHNNASNQFYKSSGMNKVSEQYVYTMELNI